MRNIKDYCMLALASISYYETVMSSAHPSTGFTVGSVKFVEIFHDESGSSRGCGIIEFDSDELVDLAIEKMHRYELKGRNIVVKEVRVTDR